MINCMQIREERGGLERVNRGEQEPSPVEERWDSCKLALPLWTVGFAVV